MKKPVMPWSFSGLIRFFCACFFALLCCAPAGAAELEWQALPDRERVSIRMDQSEGVAGDVARIAPTGVIIPFSEVPPGLFVGAAPEGASIFKGTRQQGRSLILETQTAEFGFVLSSKTATSLVVDFFHNPLGARWKASSKAPTTEIPPDFAIPPMAPADEVSVALSTDPEGTSAASVALASGRSGSAPTPPAAPDRQSNATSATPPAAATPDATARPVDPNRARPVVVALSGTPDHASTVTRMADAPPTVASPTPVIGPQSQAKAAAPATPALPPPVLDSRTQTQERSAPLPLPEPPLSVSVAAPRTDRDAGESPAERQPSPVAQVEAATAASEPEARSPTGPAASPAVAPIAPSSPPATRSAATPAPVAASPSPPTAPPVGVGVPTGSGIYGGLINTGGLEALPPDGADGYRDSPVEPPASSAGEAAGEAAEEVNGTAASSVEDSGSPAEPVQSREIDVPASPESRGGKDVPPQDNATVIYLDEEGKPVEPPPKPEVMLPEMRGRIGKGDFAGALGIAEDLLARATLDKDQREEVLHARAEMLFALNKDDLGPSYREISDATNQAISFNSKSLRNAGAHLRLGFMNLKMGNLPEAEAHFNMLRRLYPNDENVPLSYYYWGDYHFGRGEVQKAADEFQYVLQEYTNSRYAREAALG
ncbi:MAG: hypothetical protein LBH65_02140, partial [Desulfovibrio sp.]|nr:hypothetical protein [Desulfovibrio sp.]